MSTSQNNGETMIHRVFLWRYNFCYNLSASTECFPESRSGFEVRLFRKTKCGQHNVSADLHLGTISVERRNEEPGGNWRSSMIEYQP